MPSQFEKWCQRLLAILGAEHRLNKGRGKENVVAVRQCVVSFATALLLCLIFAIYTHFLPTTPIEEVNKAAYEEALRILDEY